MDVQLLIVNVLIVLAVGYLSRATWRTWTKTGSSCGGGCAKSRCSTEEQRTGRIALL
jgi:ABC-type uncharacterized transport system YnjBCD permease subunit